VGDAVAVAGGRLVAVSDGVLVLIGVAEGDGLGGGLAVVTGFGDGEGDSVGDTVGVAVRVTIGPLVLVAVMVAAGVAVDVHVGLAVRVGVFVGVLVGGLIAAPPEFPELTAGAVGATMAKCAWTLVNGSPAPSTSAVRFAL